MTDPLHLTPVGLPERASERDSLPTTTLPTAVAFELAHALVQRECDRQGIDVLFLKGPGAHSQGLRPPKASSDVDVLVLPDDCARLQEALRPAGWVQRPAGQTGVALAHATTLCHPHWPIDIDIHWSIPGLSLDAAAAFRSLRRRSVSVVLAHWDVSYPHRVDHALLLALNAIRSPWDEASRASLSYLSDSLDDTEMEELGSRITALECGPAMAPFAVEHSRGLIAPDASAPSREWMLYQRQDHPAVLWLDALQQAPLRQKLTIAVRAVVPSRRSLAADDLRLAEAPAGALTRRRHDRLVRFLRSSPAALRSYLEFRRTLRDTRNTDKGRQS